MKLYELKKGDKFIITDEMDSPTFEFEKVDGMYSICFINKEIIHLSASTPVERVE